MSMQPSPKVFLSYSTKDKDRARRLAHDLESANVDVWFDEFELKAGDPILSSIRTAIEESGHLLVLISKNSLSSSWVERELQAAFVKHGTIGSPTIIPVRIDDAEVPEFLRSTLYVDLRSDYESGLNSLLNALSSTESDRRVSDVINASRLAENIARDVTVSRGPGFFVSTFLTILTIVATVLAAWPAFHQVFGDRSRVYYEVSQARLSIPPGLDQARIQQMLKDEGIADSNLRIAFLNRGMKEAVKVKVGIEVSGSLARFSSDPEVSTKPVWVTITPPEFAAGDTSTSFSIDNLVPDREFVANMAYFGDGDDFSCDVVSDGLLAERVDNLSSVPNSSIWSVVQTPVLILFGGILLSVLAGTVVASLANRKFRDLAFEVLNIVSPTGGRLLSAILKVMD